MSPDELAKLELFKNDDLSEKTESQITPDGSVQLELFEINDLSDGNLNI